MSSVNDTAGREIQLKSVGVTFSGENTDIDSVRSPEGTQPSGGATSADMIVSSGDGNGNDSDGEVHEVIDLGVSSKQNRNLTVSSLMNTVDTGEGDEETSTKSSKARSRRSTVFDVADEAIHALEDVMHDAFHAPSAKYTWNEDHTKLFRQGGHLEENWLPEFLDLILVAGLIKLGDGLHYCGLHFSELCFVGVEFLIIFSTRYMIDEFMWHFYLDDVWNQMCFFSFIVGLFLMTKMMSFSLDDNYECSLSVFHLSLFFGGLLITRVILSMFWMVELYFDDDARDLYYMYPVRNMLSICLSIAGIVLLNAVDSFEVEYAYGMLGGVIFVEYYFHFYKAIHRSPLLDLNEYWPLRYFSIKTHDHDHERLFECDEELETVQTRCGVFILIVLGESMIQLLIPSFDLAHKNEMVSLTVIGLALVWLVAKQFFDAAQREPHGHALRRTMQSGTQWIVMHAISGWFAFILGIGLKMLYADLRYDEETNMEHIWFMSIGAFGTVASFTYMRFLHKGWGEWPHNRNRLLGYLLRFGIGLIHLTVPYWGMDRPDLVVLSHTCIAGFLVSLDLYNYKIEHHLNNDEKDGESVEKYYEGNNDGGDTPDNVTYNEDGSVAGSTISSPKRTGFEQMFGLNLDRSDSSASFSLFPGFGQSPNNAEGSAGTGTPNRGLSRDNSYANLNGSSSNIYAPREGSNVRLSREGSYSKISGSSSNLFGSSSNLLGALDLLKERRERGAKGRGGAQPSSSHSSHHKEKEKEKPPHRIPNRHSSSSAVIGSNTPSKTNSRANSSSNIFADAVAKDGTLDMEKIRARLGSPETYTKVLLDEDDSEDEADVISVKANNKIKKRSSAHT
jgi:hypothetical protein